MALGQAAATAAAVCLDTSTSVQDADIGELQRLLREQGQMF